MPSRELLEESGVSLAVTAVLQVPQGPRLRALPRHRLPRPQGGRRAAGAERRDARGDHQSRAGAPAQGARARRPACGCSAPPRSIWCAGADHARGGESCHRYGVTRSASTWRRSALCLVRLKRGLKPTRRRRARAGASRPISWADWDRCARVLPSVAGAAAVGGRAQSASCSRITGCATRSCPGSRSSRSAEERLAHARQLLTSVYGDAVSDWEVRCLDAPPGRAAGGLRDAGRAAERVRDAAARSTVRSWLSLQPQLIAAYDTWRHTSAGRGRLVRHHRRGHARRCARLRRRAGIGSTACALAPDWTRELKRLQTFGRLASQSPAGRARCTWTRRMPGARSPARRGRDLHWLEEDERPLTTLQRLARVRRLAA